MSKPKIKQIRNINEVPDDEDACTFFLQYEPEMMQIMLTITTKRSITPEEYIDALAAFVNEVSEHPQNLFVEDMSGDDSPLH